MNEPSVFNGPEVTMAKDKLHGEVEHRDFVLESDEYDSAIMVCVSRGRGDIEIDFEDY